MTDAAPRNALVYVLVGGVGAALWLPFGRDNFYLAFSPIVALVEGVALGLPFALLVNRLRPPVPESQ